MADDFDVAPYRLHSCQVRLLEDLIYINLSDSDETVADFDRIATDLTPFVRPHGLTRARIAHRQNYPIDANWKLVTENGLECYHCQHAHPQYASVNAYVRADNKAPGSYERARERWVAKAMALGHMTSNVSSDADTPQQPYGAGRQPIQEGFVTHTEDGKPAAPLMGDFSEYDGGETFVFVGPLNFFYCANDHAVTFRITPLRVDRTDLEVVWLVDEDAKEGVDYDRKRLTWMWDVTTEQDKTIITNNQAGVSSRRYTPGPYGEREYFADFFARWYLSRIAGTPISFDAFSVFT